MKKNNTARPAVLYGISIPVLILTILLSFCYALFIFFGKSLSTVTYTEEIVYEVKLPENTTEIENEKEEEISFEEPSDLPPIKLIDVPYVNQKKKFPTGCEALSTVMAMRHAGYSISGKYFINHFLSVAPAPFIDSSGRSMGYDPREYFLGNPYSQSGWGCMAPVIEKALKKCISPKKYSVKNITGTPLYDLRSYIDRDIPVIMWATQGMAPARKSRTWTLVGTDETYTWISPNHCLLLTGYDTEGYYFNDPLSHKDCRYPANIVEDRYNNTGKQAIVIDFPETE